MDRQEDGHYPGHMFVLMVIHYLQQIGILPVLYEVYTIKLSCKLHMYTCTHIISCTVYTVHLHTCVSTDTYI